ncbi:LOW QUALITY PROTEIN: hypothetical protein AQUCO_02300217v1 [Aquilegia coerulea]|uniref:Pentatricopeptide repeat-containing protein n=1 Tax=Aquilegia coerulea TaxID=218851 RepID=A0A2G5DCS9_AQUCA|nr:LOW QUALITY PROTEIN: hypothetical protein AQUCO_02300217v1 [Aquilegia coerulea]
MPSYGCQPNVIILCSMCTTGRWMDAVEHLADMICKGCLPSVTTTIMDSLNKKGRAMKYVDVMVSRGCYPDIITYNTLLTAFDGKVDLVIELLHQLGNKGCSLVLITYNTVMLVHMGD